MTLLLTLDDGSVQRKLADAVEFARAAVLEDAPEEQLGAHVGVTREDAVTASHLFEAQVPGYGGWRWSVTVALAGDDEPVTVSEVVLVPGPSALVAPAWVPWERRVRAGDLGVGDIFPTSENDPRLAPAYVRSDDPAVEEVAHEAGLGRIHVLSRFGRTEAAARWHAGEFGPRSDMARSAPDVCGRCGFFVPLAGSLRGAFGVCTNDIAPADGHVVDVEYGCGAHSEVEVEVTSSVPVAELVYDDSLLDFAPAPEVVETAAAEPETAVAESDVSPAEVEPELAAAVEGETGSAADSTEAAVREGAPEATAPEGAEAEAAAPEAATAEPVAAAPEAAVSEAATTVAEGRAGPVVPEAADSAETAAAAGGPVAAEEAAPEADVSEAATTVVEDAAEPVASEGSAPEPAVFQTVDEAAAAGAIEEPTGQESGSADEVAEQGAAAEPVEVATESAAEPVAPEAAGEAAPVGATESSEAPVAEPAGAEATDEVAAPVVTEVPEPAEAEPTQAEVTDAIELPASSEPQGASAEAEPEEVPVAAESDAAEVDPVPAEVADRVAEPLPGGGDESTPAAAESDAAEVDPVPAEIADRVAEPLPGSGDEPAPAAAESDAAEVDPVPAEVADRVAEPLPGGGDESTPAAAESDATEVDPVPAEVTDLPVGSEASPSGTEGTAGSPADEAQAQADNAPER